MNEQVSAIGILTCIGMAVLLLYPLSKLHDDHLQERWHELAFPITIFIWIALSIATALIVVVLTSNHLWLRAMTTTALLIIAGRLVVLSTLILKRHRREGSITGRADHAFAAGRLGEMLSVYGQADDRGAAVPVLRAALPDWPVQAALIAATEELAALRMSAAVARDAGVSVALTTQVTAYAEQASSSLQTIVGLVGAAALQLGYRYVDRDSAEYAQRVGYGQVPLTRGEPSLPQWQRRLLLAPQQAPHLPPDVESQVQHISETVQELSNVAYQTRTQLAAATLRGGENLDLLDALELLRRTADQIREYTHKK